MVSRLLKLVFAIVLCTASPAHAQQRNLSVTLAGAGNRIALVIGNDSYTRVPKLTNARADARAMVGMAVLVVSGIGLPLLAARR